MSIKIKIDDADMERLRLSVRERLTDPRPVLKKFHRYMLGRTGRTFRALRRGGTFRGVTWDGYKDQYTRKTDGVTVPAWGGVPKLRGGGLVLGRLRPSGTRVTPSSNLLRDTGRLARAAGATPRWGNGGRTLHMDTNNVKYGPKQQELRSFLFFELPEDGQYLQRLALRHLEGAD